MYVFHRSAFLEYHGATELVRVLLWSCDPVAREDAFGESQPHLWTDEFQQGGSPEAQHPVGLFRSIDEQEERDVPVLLEIGRHAGQTHADRDDLGIEVLELFPPVTQLRDVLAAERSAVVTDPHDHQSMLSPQIAEPDLISAGARELDVLEVLHRLHQLSRL